MSASSTGLTASSLCDSEKYLGDATEAQLRGLVRVFVTGFTAVAFVTAVGTTAHRLWRTRELRLRNIEWAEAKSERGSMVYASTMIGGTSEAVGREREKKN